MSTDHQYQPELGLRESGPVRRVEDYTFEPIRGYPMLHWAGKRPFTSTQYYPAQHKETYGPEVNGWRNKLYWGDNLQVMSHLLKEYRGKIKLVYIDPPYDSKADYKRTISVRGREAQNDRDIFEEKQYTDIWTNDEYLQFMYERLILLKELLSDDGSIYVHMGWQKDSYIRCIMDEIFGPNNLRNEIVWQRFNFHADANRFGSVHEIIWFYTKNSSATFHKQYMPLKESYINSHYTLQDENGRRYRLDNPTAPAHGKTGKPMRFGEKLINPPAGAMWRWSQENIDRLWAEGKIVFNESSMPGVKRYLDEGEGMAVHSIWTDVHAINSQAKERTDYPTQKPETLLERIIKASSNPGDIVFDCFMGSGTTQAVAMKLGRRFLGADINLGAVQITTKRLLAVASELGAQPQPLMPEEGQPSVFYTGFEVYNVNNYDIFRNPVEAKELLIKALEVNPLPPGSLFDGEQDGRMVKIMPINRIATRQDLNELITGFDYRAFEKRQAEHPNQPVEKVTLVCMGHEPDLAAQLQRQMAPFKLDIQVVDILRDKQDLQFKRDSEAKIVIRDGELVIEQFYPMNLLKKLSLQQEYVEDWRELVDAVMIDWNYDGAVLQPAVIDIPEGNRLVAGRYPVPDDAGTIRVKITDLLSESLEMELSYA
jgi:adenine-specific DNA-methyltransferase